MLNINSDIRSVNGEMDFEYKIIVVGESGTGKSNIITQFVENRFNEFTRTTMGVDFKTKHIQLYGINISLQLWDTAGQERFRSMGSSYYHNSCGVIIVYDITRRSTFEKIESWIDEIKKNLDVDISEIEVMIIGNKTDLEKKRTVSHYDVDKINHLCNFTYMETCAKDNKSITDAIIKLVTNIHQRGLGSPKYQKMEIDNNKKNDLSCCVIL